jgi:flagellar biosynthesis chaperone FliJ
MQRFHFRLEQLLKLKQQRAWLAEMAQQKARLAVEAARARVGELKQQLEAVARQLQSGQVPAQRWPAAYAHSTRLGRDLTTAEAEVVRTERQLQEATVHRVRQTQEVETLLHLRAHAWQEHREEGQAVEQRRVDEQTMQRWQASRARRSPQGEGP